MTADAIASATAETSRVLEAAAESALLMFGCQRRKNCFTKFLRIASKFDRRGHRKLFLMYWSYIPGTRSTVDRDTSTSGFRETVKWQIDF